jgi:hypothetical protein
MDAQTWAALASTIIALAALAFSAGHARAFTCSRSDRLRSILSPSSGHPVGCFFRGGHGYRVAVHTRG